MAGVGHIDPRRALGATGTMPGAAVCLGPRGRLPMAWLVGLFLVGCTETGTDNRAIPPGAVTNTPGAATDPGSDGRPSTSDDTFDNPATPIGNPSVAPGAPGAPQAPTPVTAPTDFEACASDVQGATGVEVDMYIMLDRSGSMLAQTGTGSSKWDATVAALTSFVQDAASAGLGVGLQYFPLGRPGVAESCLVESDCGGFGPCTNRGCVPPRFSLNPVFTECFSDDECPLGSPGCQPIGVCENDPTLACFDLGGQCTTAGACVPLSGECLGYATCETVAYATPDVPIGLLPDNGTALVTSLSTAQPTGLTPTSAALRGALEHASTHAQANPDRRVITVLATDGLPTDCLTPDIRSLDDAVNAVATEATAALNGQPSIPTYVVGVFSPEEPEAMEKLDQIAQAGGTAGAFIVDPTADVSQQFLDALAEIRAGSLGCEFQLPTASPGTQLDLMLVNVELIDDASDSAETLSFVGDAAGCGQTSLEWYYASGAGGERTIATCPSTCEQLKAARGASVQVRVGCPTVGPI